MRTFIFGGTVAEETTILEHNQFYYNTWNNNYVSLEEL